MLRLGSLSLLWLVLAAGAARADAIPTCPPGTHVVMGPVAPGAMHHGGGSCVADEATVPTPPTDPEAPTPPAAPIATPPGETPPATPEAALPTAPASTPPVAAHAEPSASGCSAGRPASAGALLAGLVLLALAARRASGRR